MRAQLIGEAPKADGGEEVDREARVARILARENSDERVRVHWVRQALAERLEAEELGELLEEDLDKDARRRRCFFLVQPDVPGEAESWETQKKTRASAGSSA